MLDVIIIGAGVTGCAIARELSKYRLQTLVLEKHSDVCEGTSKANSGIAHAGHDARPGTLKAKLNVRGNQLIRELSKTLDFPFRDNGSLVLCFEEEGRATLEKLLQQGKENGVPDLEILEADRLHALEPNISDRAICALYAPTGGIVCPFGMTIAFAENAYDNGVNFSLKTEVRSIEKMQEGYRVNTNRGAFECKVLVNAAGCNAGEIHNQVCKDPIHILPRRGEYCLMDKTVGDYVSHTIFQLPTKLGKGVLVTPTVHGNLLAGPTAMEIEDGEDTVTTAAGLSEVLEKAAYSVKELPAKQVITSFAGVRAHEEGGDFILGPCKDAPGYFDAAGIESPGLTCAPALGEYLAEQILAYLPAEKNPDFKESRKGIPSMALATPEEKQALIRENPMYANVICRCEGVTEGEIVDSIRRPLGASTIDGVKRRTRAGMGRCQAGFCTPRVVEILARELGCDPSEVRKNDEGSELITGFPKEDF